VLACISCEDTLLGARVRILNRNILLLNRALSLRSVTVSALRVLCGPKVSFFEVSYYFTAHDRHASKTAMFPKLSATLI
jgi:hypothetical protein